MIAGNLSGAVRSLALSEKLRRRGGEPSHGDEDQLQATVPQLRGDGAGQGLVADRQEDRVPHLQDALQFGTSLQPTAALSSTFVLLTMLYV